MTLYFLNYNNYYNRQIKRESALSAYLSYQLGDPMTGVQFNPNDGVATNHVVNRNMTDIGDYMLVVNPDNTINSRWFIIDINRLRTGQYNVTLRRDVVADHYEPIINAPCFIEKATLNQNDPMIFNSENMTFNQIKTNEILLKDGTNSAWIVGYVPSNFPETSKEIFGKAITSPVADIELESLGNWEYYEYVSNPMKYINSGNCKLSLNIADNPDRYPGNSIIMNINQNSSAPNYGITFLNASYNPYSEIEYLYFNNSPNSSELNEIGNMITNNYNSIANNIISDINSDLGTVSPLEKNELLQLNNKIIHELSTNIFYRISVITNTSSEPYTPYVRQGGLFQTLSTNLLRQFSLTTGNNISILGDITAGSFGSFRYEYVLDEYIIRLEQVIDSVKTTLSQDRIRLADSPYDMFCIPYSDDLTIYQNGVELFTSNKSIAMGMGLGIVTDSGVGTIYDLQLLPYCPVQGLIQADGTFDIKGLGINFITNANNENVGIIIWASNSNFSFNIPSPINITNTKLSNECDIYRLCSPNYGSAFEFSPAKNGGVEYFNVDCTYKPYSPYIHINPNFKGLYGQDFNDSRGLVCGGDFSLPQVTDAWATYELQNKNYQASFDRQIENMEVNNAIQRERELWQFGTGIASSAISGATSGGLIGGPIGAVIGGIAGAGVSAFGGAQDIRLADRARAEAIDYTKDQFGYSLGNIKALPNSLSKTSAITFNNKLFPFIEYYTCTDEEKQALINKLKYNGMTVMRIGTISEFQQAEPTYIKGQLIRLENINEDFHVINEIANEINKGVFI